MINCDIAIIGGGMVGAALGFGLAKAGKHTLMLDQGDQALRAARGNFGLVWVQGKGADFPSYAHWTLESSQLWPQFAADLATLTGIDVQYQQRGGLELFLDEAELDGYDKELALQVEITDKAFQYQRLNPEQLAQKEPYIGKDVIGATYSPHDGHVNPLLLLRAMQAGFQLCGGQYQSQQTVSDIEPNSEGFRLNTVKGQVQAKKIILAAGLDNARLAPMVGLSQNLHPQRGQILVTEKLPPILNHPTNYLRQTQDGTIQIGASSEQTGLDDANTVNIMAQLAKRAKQLMPVLAEQNIVRAWGALRVLSPDSFPIYDKAPFPGAYAISCHSAVTLAAAHANTLAQLIADDSWSTSMDTFSAARFRD